MFDPHLQENGEWKPFQGHMTDLFADKALEWISSGKQPWFCYLALNAPHVPLQIGEEWAKPYLDAGLPERLAKFYGMITHLDAALGRVLARLAAQGVLHKTIVIFLGDNGSALGGNPQPGEFNGGLRGTKGSAYQGGVRIPAVFSWPDRFAEGASIDTLASLCDVLPTLAQACGLNLRDFPESDGRSLMPILVSGKQPADWKDRVVPTHVARWPSGTAVEKLPFLNASVRNQRHSLVNGEELYDLQSDPSEKNNIARENPEILGRLRKAHRGWWESVRDSAMDTQPFVIGQPGQGAVELTCMDWQPSRATSEPLPVGLWEQETLRKWQAGIKASGVDGACGGWLVDVKSPGEYLLEFRSRPQDAAESRPFAKGSVSLAIAGEVFQSDIPEGSDHVRMEVVLPEGRHFLEPVLLGQRASDLPQGAYFCRVLPKTIP
jgi:hypothetical protein